jgi:hypothetical protein
MSSALPPTSEIRPQRCFTIESTMAGSIYFQQIPWGGCAPSMPVTDDEFRDAENLARQTSFRVGAVCRLEISSSLSSQAHEKMRHKYSREWGKNKITRREIYPG